MAEIVDQSRYHPFHWKRVDLGALDLGDLQAVVGQWHRSLGTGRAIPEWTPLALEHLSNRLLPFTNVIDVGAGEPPFSYRFFGSGLADVHTFELTNKTTDAIEPDGFRNLCVDQYILTLKAHEPLSFLNEIPTRTEGLFRRHLMLRLPYASVDGTVSNIMTVEESESGPRETWERFQTPEDC